MSNNRGLSMMMQMVRVRWETTGPTTFLGVFVPTDDYRDRGQRVKAIIISLLNTTIIDGAQFMS